MKIDKVKLFECTCHWILGLIIAVAILTMGGLVIWFSFNGSWWIGSHLVAVMLGYSVKRSSYED